MNFSIQVRPHTGEFPWIAQLCDSDGAPLMFFAEGDTPREAINGILDEIDYGVSRADTEKYYSRFVAVAE